MNLDISRCSVVIADGDAAAAGHAGALLEAADFECTCCATPATLVELLSGQAARFDAIVLGIDARRGTGSDVLRALKTEPTLRRIPVVIVGPAHDGHVVSAGIRAGAHYFVPRPLDPALLVSVLRAAIAERRAYVDLERELEVTVGSVALLRRAEFEFRTVEQARLLAGLLAKVAADPVRVVTGLWELMLNAVEHGNLGLDYAAKSALVEANAWADEIERRLACEPYRNRVARVSVMHDDAALRYRIVDSGEGFEPSPFLDFDPGRLAHVHGRGIAMARRVSFDEVRYHGKGNDVEATVYLETMSPDTHSRDYGVALRAVSSTA